MRGLSALILTLAFKKADSMGESDVQRLSLTILTSASGEGSPAVKYAMSIETSMILGEVGMVEPLLRSD